MAFLGVSQDDRILELPFFSFVCQMLRIIFVPIRFETISFSAPLIKLRPRSRLPENISIVFPISRDRSEYRRLCTSIFSEHCRCVSINFPRLFAEFLIWGAV